MIVDPFSRRWVYFSVLSASHHQYHQSWGMRETLQRHLAAVGVQIPNPTCLSLSANYRFYLANNHVILSETPSDTKSHLKSHVHFIVLGEICWEGQCRKKRLGAWRGFIGGICWMFLGAAGGRGVSATAGHLARHNSLCAWQYMRPYEQHFGWPFHSAAQCQHGRRLGLVKICQEAARITCL